jgi:SAM-dependent methyltransferase
MEELRSTLERRRPAGSAPRVLDAGCGSATHIALPPNAYVVGVDVSREALERNPRLDERVVADLETVELPRGSFDVIVCWNVLEHLKRPERALDAFASALAEGGLLVLGAPNVHSLKGIVTKFTPYWFHRWVYRKAGVTTGLPHRTFLRAAIAPNAVRRWAQEAGLTLEYLRMYEAPIQARLRRALRLTGRSWAAFVAGLRVLSVGRIATSDTDFIMILSKPGQLAAGPPTSAAERMRI